MSEPMQSSVELRPNGYPRNRRGQQTLDEVVATGIDSFHIESMDKGLFWFVLRKGDDEWHFWMSAVKGNIQLVCSEGPGVSEDGDPPA